MEISVDTELQQICENIQSQSFTEDEWSARESDDEFQTKNYCGGYDADEKAFCFSYFSPQKKEYWFQFSLKEATEIFNGDIRSIPAREAG